LTILNRNYADTHYHFFQNRLMRWMIDQTLLTAKRSDNSRELMLLTSGLASNRTSSEWLKTDFEFLWNAARFWANYSVSPNDLFSDWGNSWSGYVWHIPNAGYGDWEEWDEFFSSLTLNLYIQFWAKLFRNGVPEEVRTRFWNSLWEEYCRHRSINPGTSREITVPMLRRIASQFIDYKSIMENVDSVLQEICETADIPWYQVEQPIWAQSISKLLPILHGKPDMPIGWDVVFILLLLAANHDFSELSLTGFFESQDKSIQDWLHVEIEEMKKKPVGCFEFWFPLQNHTSKPILEVSLNQSTRIVGVSVEQAKLLSEASGISPRPTVSEGDAFVVIRRMHKSPLRAREDAIRELGNTQTMLRTADTGFRWEAAFFYFWTFISDDLDPHFKDHFVAERRDNRQIYPPLSEDWLIKYRDWVSSIEANTSELGEALFIAMRWQGLSRVQDGAESEFLCLWIALERLGNGGYHYKRLIPHFAGTIWHWSMFQGVEPQRRLRGIYHDRRNVENLINQLAGIRSHEVAHRGQFRGKKDIRYGTWLLKHLVNDLTVCLMEILQRNNNIKKFEDMERYMDERAGFI
jgi:hypothetical protein